MNFYDTLKERAEKVGISIDQMCEIGDINRSTLERWKAGPPKSIATYLKILNKIEELEKQVA